ncbi:uncharacterized protein LOC119798652 [Cyprinodon tularosa]|uniref:uncharacterized protein LOC119798652 n=1 Tax=Cyprinodon tularosa TaxID=77115 RepID=UPI0018E245CE|nr:uncharacterized protein LOC119798652 [Cyprinodon tularosa]
MKPENMLNEELSGLEGCRKLSEGNKVAGLRKTINYAPTPESEASTSRINCLVGSDRSISAVIGGDVTLPCKAEGYMPFKVVEWSRPGEHLEYVLILRNKNLDPKIPKPGYKGRVELKDLQNGDVSLVLRNVTSEDSGTYECYVLKKTVRRKRAIKPISTITLNVLRPLGSDHESQDDGGNKDGSDGLTGVGLIGLCVGLVSVAAVIVSAVSAVLLLKKKKKRVPSSPIYIQVDSLQELSPTGVDKSGHFPLLSHHCKPAIGETGCCPNAGPKPGQMGRV